MRAPLRDRTGCDRFCVDADGALGDAVLACPLRLVVTDGQPRCDIGDDGPLIGLAPPVVTTLGTRSRRGRIGARLDCSVQDSKVGAVDDVALRKPEVLWPSCDVSLVCAQCVQSERCVALSDTQERIPVECRFCPALDFVFGQSWESLGTLPSTDVFVKLNGTSVTGVGKR